ncbi:TPA: redoxin domain-containing protein [Candidatus Poribacteria bacterium]|nr:redoxin domain-containing protein [Candidatus Poribacteria bacterium]
MLLLLILLPARVKFRKLKFCCELMDWHTISNRNTNEMGIYTFQTFPLLIVRISLLHLMKSCTICQWRFINMIPKILVSIFVAFIIATLDIRTEEDRMKNLKIGMVAPDFTLMGDDGQKHKISQHLGKKNVVLAFYPKDFTGG